MVKRTCIFCEKEYETAHENISKYCSRTCANKYHYQKKKKPTEATCIHCGNKFPKRANKNHTCNNCMDKKKNGIRPDIHTEVVSRDNSKIEADMIKNFLKNNNVNKVESR